MFPEAVIDDLKDLSNVPRLLRKIMPKEADIIEKEFMEEIEELTHRKAERPIDQNRDVEIPSDEYIIRKSFIHGTGRESYLTGADVAVEIVGKKLILWQAKKETITWNGRGTQIESRRFEFDRSQMTMLMWLNDEIMSHISPVKFICEYPYVHPLSYKASCFYKLIFLDAPEKKPTTLGQIHVAEERYIPVKQVNVILGSNKNVSAVEIRTGYRSEEFQNAAKSCDVGCVDSIDETLKKKIFHEFSMLSNRLVVLFNIQSKRA